LDAAIAQLVPFSIRAAISTARADVVGERPP
jgi:hypothetical protein